MTSIGATNVLIGQAYRDTHSCAIPFSVLFKPQVLRLTRGASLGLKVFGKGAGGKLFLQKGLPPTLSSIIAQEPVEGEVGEGDGLVGGLGSALVEAADGLVGQDDEARVG